jgi:hypothetical protein
MSDPFTVEGTIVSVKVNGPTSAPRSYEVIIDDYDPADTGAFSDVWKAVFQGPTEIESFKSEYDKNNSGRFRITGETVRKTVIIHPTITLLP